MQQVTDMEEDPETDTLWISGFNLEPSLADLKDWADVSESFYQPRLARISPENAVELITIGGEHDLAMPLSILWRR
jgi:hypothetical protein